MPCQYPPSHKSPSGKRHSNCKGYSPKRKPYKTAKGTRCCALNKGPHPKTGTKCGTVEKYGDEDGFQFIKALKVECII